MKTTICDYHDIIIEKAKELIKLNEKDFDEIGDLLTKVRDLADDIEIAGLNALTRGQSMEYRLLDYRRAIEALGFERKKK